MSAELHPRLAQMLEDSGAQTWLDVILELKTAPDEPAASRAEAVARKKAGFHTIAESVKDVVGLCGGTVEGEAWLNSTIKCRVPAGALRALSATPDIVKIDVPHDLSREG